MLKGISTQEEISSFKKALELLASNLDFHVNSSLSKAHGIELVYGFIDDESNDRRTYQDTYGKIVSGSDVTKPNFIRFVVDGVAYYAPCIYGADPGAQAASTGIIQPTLEPSAVEETSLITDYVTNEILTASGINGYLLAHSLLTNQIAHTPLTVLVRPTYAHSGALIADYVIQIAFNNYVYQIPCTTRIGGPAQPTGQIAALALYIPAGGGDPSDVQSTLSGIAAQTYTVTLKVRGVVEGKPYASLGVPGHLVSVSPVPPNTATPPYCYQTTTPTLPVSQNRLNEFALTVSNPAQIYLLNNSTTSQKGARWQLDYTFNFSAITGATLTLAARTIHGASAGNTLRLSISDNNPPLILFPPYNVLPAQPYTGQWIQIDAVSVVKSA